MKVELTEEDIAALAFVSGYVIAKGEIECWQSLQHKGDQLWEIVLRARQAEEEDENHS